MPQASAALGSDIFDYYAHHPDEIAIFHKTMQASTVGVTAEIGQRLDTSRSLLAIDIGGATGSLLYSLMQINPLLRGIVFDRPENAVQAEAAAAFLGLSERTTAVAGNFFEAVPAGDLYILRFILSDWNDEDCIRILKTCRRAMMPGGRLVIVESFLSRVGQDGSPDIADTQGAIIDLHMFVVAGGTERSDDWPDIDRHDQAHHPATPMQHQMRIPAHVAPTRGTVHQRSGGEYGGQNSLPSIA